MTHDTPAYGLWSLVLINSAVFIIFAFSFTHPRSPRDWRSFSAFAAFLVALFTDRHFPHASAGRDDGRLKHRNVVYVPWETL